MFLKVFLKGTQGLIYKTWPRWSSNQDWTNLSSPVASSAPTLEFSEKTGLFLFSTSEDSSHDSFDKEHLKTMIVKIVFPLCVVRPGKPVIESRIPKLKQLEELLVATGFPLNSTRWWIILLWKIVKMPFQLTYPANPQVSAVPTHKTVFKYGLDWMCQRFRFCSWVGHFLRCSSSSCLNPGESWASLSCFESL